LLRAQQERRGERDGGQGVAGIVDQVGQQRDAVGGDVDRGLYQRGCGQDAKRGGDDPQPLARTRDRRIDQAVAVIVRVPVRRGDDAFRMVAQPTTSLVAGRVARRPASPS
jgi:hypothetical protein